MYPSIKNLKFSGLIEYFIKIYLSQENLILKKIQIIIKIILMKFFINIRDINKKNNKQYF